MTTTRDNGSSPLTRGKPGEIIKGDNVRRLIPAHAGKTVGGGEPESVDGAHPRSRGENGDQRRPRVRLFRLIPAHAGKTCRTPP